MSGPLHNPAVRGFASDNYAGAHPEIIEAIGSANGGHVVAYGEDEYTERLQEVVKAHFGPSAAAFPVFNGTGANVLSLQTLLPRWGAVVCADTAHINTDENAAPERVAGIKLLPVATTDGKLTPELIDKEAWGWGDEHRAQPLAVSITQTTEVGTCYTPQEVRRIAEHVHSLGMKLHMDGARLANAAAHLKVPFKAFTTDAGVDILSFGGTKNGLLYGEAVIVLDAETGNGMKHLRKMDMQLASKMRFVSAQLIALLESGLWLRSAAHANEMASRLRRGIEAIDGVRLTRETQSNGVFASLHPAAADLVRRDFRFYDWDRATGEVRWMCSFDTTDEDVDGLVAALDAAVTKVSLRTTETAGRP